jgi:hypothetical protein
MPAAAHGLGVDPPHVKPQVVPSQVAVAPAGIGQGEQSVPQLAAELLSAHVEPQRCVLPAWHIGPSPTPVPPIPAPPALLPPIPSPPTPVPPVVLPSIPAPPPAAPAPRPPRSLLPGDPAFALLFIPPAAAPPIDLAPPTPVAARPAAPSDPPV